MNWHRFWISIPFTIGFFLFYLAFGYLAFGYLAEEKVTRRNFWLAVGGAAVYMALANT